MEAFQLRVKLLSHSSSFPPVHHVISVYRCPLPFLSSTAVWQKYSTVKVRRSVGNCKYRRLSGWCAVRPESHVLAGALTYPTPNWEQSRGTAAKFWDGSASVCLSSLRWDSIEATCDSSLQSPLLLLHLNDYIYTAQTSAHYERWHDPVTSYLKIRDKTSPSFWHMRSNLLFL